MVMWIYQKAIEAMPQRSISCDSLHIKGLTGTKYCLVHDLLSDD